MSGSNDETANTGGQAGGEPSMEEILASIRRILKDDQPGPAQDSDADEDVLVLDSSMVIKPGIAPVPVPEPVPEPIAEPIPEPEPVPAPAWVPEPAPVPEPVAEQTVRAPEPAALGFEVPAEPEFSPDPATPKSSGDGPDEFAAGDDFNANTEAQNMSDPAPEYVQPPEGLVSEAASEAASGSIGALIRSISSDRQIAIGRVGLTLEDLVREELRPLLKSWLDTNLPALVERIVRAEIQRVIERQAR